MREYHKIQTMFLRDPETRHKTLLIGQWATPEFEYLSGGEWVWTEKVDGTNIRIHWDALDMRIGGKTDNAQIPVFLYDRLNGIFHPDNLAHCFPLNDERANITLYGEGYGSKIQKGGGNYNPNGVDFVLFDVLINDIWLERGNVEDIALKLGIRSVPEVGRGTLDEAVGKVQFGFDSQWGAFRAEGLVCRPLIELLDRRGHRIITKIKTKDF